MPKRRGIIKNGNRKKKAAKHRTTLVRLETSGKRREISPPLSKFLIKGNSVVVVGKPKTHTTMEPKRKAEDSRERREKIEALHPFNLPLSLSPHMDIVCDSRKPDRLAHG
jgi:hypothetical protein